MVLQSNAQPVKTQAGPSSPSSLFIECLSLIMLVNASLISQCLSTLSLSTIVCIAVTTAVEDNNTCEQGNRTICQNVIFWMRYMYMKTLIKIHSKWLSIRMNLYLRVSVIQMLTNILLLVFADIHYLVWRHIYIQHSRQYFV